MEKTPSYRVIYREHSKKWLVKLYGFGPNAEEGLAFTSEDSAIMYATQCMNMCYSKKQK